MVICESSKAALRWLTLLWGQSVGIWTCSEGKANGIYGKNEYMYERVNSKIIPKFFLSKPRNGFTIPYDGELCRLEMKVRSSVLDL